MEGKNAYMEDPASIEQWKAADPEKNVDSEEEE